jgi:hypothetical protein
MVDVAQRNPGCDEVGGVSNGREQVAEVEELREEHEWGKEK